MGQNDRLVRGLCMWRRGFLTAALTLAGCAATPPPEPGEATLPGVPAISWSPKVLVCRRATTPPVIDGRLSDPCWAGAEWTDEFVDIRGDAKPRPRFSTRAAVLWDEENLYFAARLEEPDVWGKLTARDSVVYYDNDFEVFLDPDGDTHLYCELEINALGTEWDLLIVKPYRDGGPAVHAWDIPGLRTAVHVEGTLNRPGDRDEGWTLEIAMPFAVLAEVAGRASPPAAGDVWRANFSRVEWQVSAAGGVYEKLTDPESGKSLPEDNWVWSPQGLVNLHYPEMWGFLVFEGDEPVDRTPGPEERAKWELRRVYYAERTFRDREGRFTADAADLGIDVPPGISIRLTEDGFIAGAAFGEGRMVIREDGRVWRVDGVR